MILDHAAPAPLCPPAADADVSLVRRVAAGDREAHRLLFDRFGREILAYLIGRIGDRPAAEDLLHGRWLVLRRGKKNLAAVEVVAG